MMFQSLMTKPFSACVVLGFILLPSGVLALTGNLRGNCWRIAQEHFPNAELIGMLGGSMDDFNVRGYLIDQFNNPQMFRCLYRFSHGQPARFLSDLYAEDEKHPIEFTRQKYESLHAAERDSMEDKEQRLEEREKAKRKAAGKARKAAISQEYEARYRASEAEELLLQ